MKKHLIARKNHKGVLVNCKGEVIDIIDVDLMPMENYTLLDKDKLDQCVIDLLKESK